MRFLFLFLFFFSFSLEVKILLKSASFARFPVVFVNAFVILMIDFDCSFSF